VRGECKSALVSVLLISSSSECQLVESRGNSTPIRAGMTGSSANPLPPPSCSTAQLLNYTTTLHPTASTLSTLSHPVSTRVSRVNPDFDVADSPLPPLPSTTQLRPGAPGHIHGTLPHPLHPVPLHPATYQVS